MSNILNELIQESTSAGNIELPRPQLVALTRAVNALIFTDLVASQETKSPISTLFGVRYMNADGEMTFRTPATYGGKYGDRSGIDSELSAANTSFAKEDVFKYQNVVYQALEAVNISDLGGGDDIDKQLAIALMLNKVRIISDAAEVSENEYVEPSEANLKIDRWKIEARTRKLKSSVTNEFLQDITASGFDGESVIRDMLATELSDEINKDIMHKLQTVSVRHETAGIDAGIYYAGSASDDPTKGRTLYRIVCEMARAVHSDTAFEATYVLCSARVAALLSSSGWIKGDQNMKNLYTGILVDGLKVYVDAVSKFDYVIVGTKQTKGDLENVGSLFYTPYVEVDGVNSSLTTVVDPKSLQPSFMTMTRYGLSVNPYTTKDGDETQIHQGDDWNALAGKSKYSRFVGVVF
ncbi:MAG: hypothetical protein ACRC9Y_03205 [Aeromonas veronii]